MQTGLFRYICGGPTPTPRPAGFAPGPPSPGPGSPLPALDPGRRPLAPSLALGSPLPALDSHYCFSDPHRRVPGLVVGPVHQSQSTSGVVWSALFLGPLPARTTCPLLLAPQPAPFAPVDRCSSLRTQRHSVLTLARCFSLHTQVPLTPRPLACCCSAHIQCRSVRTPSPWPARSTSGVARPGMPFPLAWAAVSGVLAAGSSVVAGRSSFPSGSGPIWIDARPHGIFGQAPLLDVVHTVRPVVLPTSNLGAPRPSGQFLWSRHQAGGSLGAV
jgi:hypothetical protein